MNDTKTFDAAIIASITSGILMVKPFSLVHEAVTWIAGHEVWTHEIAAVADVITPDLVLKFPDLPKTEEEVTAIGWEKVAVDLRAKYPNGIELEKGTGKRTRHPAQTALIARAMGESVLP